ncbi:MAG TPA: hypothetical protein VKT80_09190 [Chloroflexota bacterium]|nr:hypothetical protein [Chloroflexota bacterium]
MPSSHQVIKRLRQSSIRLAFILAIFLPVFAGGAQAQPNALIQSTVYLPQVSGAAPALSNAGRPLFRYGIVVSDTKYYPEVAKMGFGYVKLFMSWNTIESTKGQFGNYPDFAVNQAHANNVQIVALIFDTPAWANNGVHNPTNPPPTADNVAEFGNFMGAVAAHYKGQIAAYEIWNEENVSDTWGGQNPDPARYVSMLRAAYPKIKSSDPDALVISGGVANTADGNGTSAIGDLIYLQAILQGGAIGNVDAIGIHPYPGPCAPEATSCPAVPGTYFQRAVEEHNVVAQYADLPMWITEAGYFSVPSAIDPTASICDNGGGIGGFNRYEVSEATKANYLVDAYQYAYTNWPWLGMFMMMNLDFTMDSGRAQCDPVRFWSILTAPNGNGGAAGEGQAYTALKNMTKVAPRVTTDPPPSGGYPQTEGTATITGRVSDPAVTGPLTIDQVTTTIDTPSGPSSPLATASFNASGSFSVVVDVRTLSAYVNHQTYFGIHTVQDGWLLGSGGVQVKPLIRANVSSLQFQVVPGGGQPPNQVVTLLRNDQSTDPFGWAASMSPAASWLHYSLTSGGRTGTFSITLTGLTPGQTYQTTVTISCTSAPGYFANNIVIPVTFNYNP